MKDNQKYITSIVAFVTIYNTLIGQVSEFTKSPLISIVSTAGATSLVIYSLFLFWDKILWKVSPISKLIAMFVGFYNYPVLEGSWNLNYDSNFNGGEKGEGLVRLKQTYSSLHIDGEFGQKSGFETFFTLLKQKENGKWFLVYGYCNKPKDRTMMNSLSGNMHEGFAYLDIKDNNEMLGYYSNDENRKTRGFIKLTKVK